MSSIRSHTVTRLSCEKEHVYKTTFKIIPQQKNIQTLKMVFFSSKDIFWKSSFITSRSKDPFLIYDSVLSAKPPNLSKFVEKQTWNLLLTLQTPCNTFQGERFTRLQSLSKFFFLPISIFLLFLIFSSMISLNRWIFSKYFLNTKELELNNLRNLWSGKPRDFSLEIWRKGCGFLYSNFQ